MAFNAEKHSNGLFNQSVIVIIFSVLPKYEVTVSPPSYILLNATEFKVDICAK